MLYSSKVKCNALHRESKMLAMPNRRFIALICKSLYRFTTLACESVHRFTTLVYESLYYFNVVKYTTAVDGRSVPKGKTSFLDGERSYIFKNVQELAQKIFLISDANSNKTLDIRLTICYNRVTIEKEIEERKPSYE